jgi:hypothetical protein
VRVTSPSPRSLRGERVGVDYDEAIRQLSQSVYQLPEIPDMIVLGGLAAMFCWTCVILPLIYYHS